MFVRFNYYLESGIRTWKMLTDYGFELNNFNTLLIAFYYYQNQKVRYKKRFLLEN